MLWTWLGQFEMATDYHKVAADNIRRYGEDSAVLDLLRDLYAERTHFLLELLQNAEDAAASWVRFTLKPDRLELRHDGRPFTEQDVIGICGVAKGAKKDDLTQIGTFGIGFKSVYAYTDSPEIHSGDERFRVIHYVRPYLADAHADVAADETLFVFPFDRREVDASRACAEILRALRRLSARTLLFLRHIDHIDWTADDEAGSYLRQSEPFGVGRRVQVLSERSGEHIEHEDWLVFQRPIVADDAESLHVEIAFQLKEWEDGGASVQAVPNSRLVAFFPTETEIHLGFVVQGPYQTTPARDNVPRDTDWNQLLVRETSRLLVSVLPQLREMGLLSVTLLESLPIVEDGFPEEGMFRPLFDTVRQAFAREPLIPGFGGGFVRAGDAKLARGADLRALLGDGELTALFGSPDRLRWVSPEITADRAPEVFRYLRDTLDIEEVTPDSFLRRLTDEFLQDRDDEWLIALYRFFSRQEALWKQRWSGRPRGRLVELSFLRLEDGTHHRPILDDGSPAAHLPPEGDTEFPIVKRTIASDEEARAFLVNFGLSEPDIVDEVLRFVVPRYRDLDPSCVTNDDVEHDMVRILKALETDSREKKRILTEHLRRTRWLRCVNAATGEVAFRSPREIYQATEDLRLYFEGNQGTWFLDRFYDRWSDPLGDLGVARNVRVELRRPDVRGHVQLVNEWGRHERGLHGFDPDCRIDGLEHALAEITLEKASLIWNRLLDQYSNQIRGAVEISSRKEFDDPRKESRWSVMGGLVRDRVWLPIGNEGFHRPADVGLEELPEEFERDRALAAALEMRLPADIEALTEGTGLDPDVLRFFVQHPDQAEAFVRQLQQDQAGQRQRQVDIDQPADQPGPASNEKVTVSSGDDHDRLAEPRSAVGSGPVVEALPPDHPAGDATRAGSSRGAGAGVGPSRAGSDEEPGPRKTDGAGDRLPVYVEFDTSDRTEDPETRAQKAMVEAAGIRRVMDFELDQGREPVEMPPQHAGYDIESTAADGSKRIIEVKALLGRWGTPGVALTKREFDTATERGDAYWLYVVESALEDHFCIHRIQDPALRGNQFVFDRGWEALGED